MSLGSPIYLDYNSTTPCAPEVVAEMLPHFTTEYGNASSPHAMGRRAANAVAVARERVAATIGCQSSQVVFTGGATEANNLALLGLSRATVGRRKVIVSAVEHKSVLGPAAKLAEQGYAVTTLGVDCNGRVDLAAAQTVVDSDTLIVSVQAANNETGVIQPIAELCQLAHAEGALFHCDAAQALGKVPLDVSELDVDLASFSGHKVYGPKGIGALFVGPRAGGQTLRALQFGGGHERQLRPGTLNVPGIVGFGAACRIASVLCDDELARLSELREELEKDLLRRLPGSRINAKAAERLPGTSSLTIPGLPAEMLIANLTRVCIAEGSACSSWAPGPSHVLLAMNLSRLEAEATTRISLGRYTSREEIHAAAVELASIACDLLGKLSERPAAGV